MAARWQEHRREAPVLSELSELDELSGPSKQGLACYKQTEVLAVKCSFRSGPNHQPVSVTAHSSLIANPYQLTHSYLLLMHFYIDKAMVTSCCLPPQLNGPWDLL